MIDHQAVNKSVITTSSSCMPRSLGRARTRSLGALFCVFSLLWASSSFAKGRSKSPRNENVPDNAHRELWAQPPSIASRDLFYGPGGEAHEPHSTFIFAGEDLNGTNPKFDVRDETGTKWRVKLGAEARPEVAASHLLWSVGYFANEDYFVADLRVEGMKPLKRGQKLVAPDGELRNVRLKRFLKDEKKVGNWRWRSNPLFGTREFNGLRVMMALINSWDLKDQNNSVYEEKGNSDSPELHYLISDLGATFGTTGLSYPDPSSKGNLPAYASSKFIKKVTGQYVDFHVPTRPNLFHLVNPKEFIERVRLEWIGRHIPIGDVRWTAQLLSQLSREQIRQAFQAAGYLPEEVDGFTDVVEKRIAELNRL